MYAIIENILNHINVDVSDGFIRFRRPLAEMDAKRMHEFLQNLKITPTSPPPSALKKKASNVLATGIIPPLDSLKQSLSSTCVEYYGFQPIFIFAEERKGDDDNDWQICSLAQWSFGFSTWKGRVMNLDAFIPGKYETMLIKILTTIAKEMDCKRLVHQSTKESVGLFFKLHNAVELPEWLTMELNTSGMITLLNKTMFHREFPPSNEIKSVPRGTDKIQNTRDIIEEAVKTTNYFLAKKSKGSGRNIKLRVASQSDADHVLNLVKGLASFEKAVEEVIVSSNTYRRDGCGVKNPIFHCILVESLNDESNSSQIVGMGLFYFGYSALHGGRYLFLEDLFIEKQYRGLGCGTYMLSCLAEISLKIGCFRFVWQVLDWNVSAIEFYKTIGATMCTDLLTLRLNYDRICESAIPQFTSMQCNE